MPCRRILAISLALVLSFTFSLAAASPIARADGCSGVACEIVSITPAIVALGEEVDAVVSIGEVQKVIIDPGGKMLTFPPGLVTGEPL